MPQGLEVEYSDTNLAGAIERKNVNTLVIATPPQFHPKTIEVVASTGKHIFGKKRLALTFEEAGAARTAVQESIVHLPIGFMPRYDACDVSAKQAVAVDGVSSRPRRPFSICAFLEARDDTAEVDWLCSLRTRDLSNWFWVLLDQSTVIYSMGGN